jgi:hypothetical protein
MVAIPYHSAADREPRWTCQWIEPKKFELHFTLLLSCFEEPCRRQNVSEDFQRPIDFAQLVLSS